MKRFISLIFFIFILSVSLAFSQYAEVKNYLKMITAGKIDEVKLALPDLLAEYPDDPGVLLLHASVIDDAGKAIDILEKIVTKYPESEYADDAYWRIIQYYAIKGDLDKANQELDAYRKKFPTSEYLGPAADVVRTAINLSKAGSKPHPIYTEKPKKEEVVTKTDSEKEKKVQPQPQPKPIDKPKEKPKKVANDEGDTEQGTWGLQVGVYSTKEAAQNEVERFRSMRLRADIMPKKVDGASMYAVVIGDYSSKESAEAAKNVVQSQCNCSPMIFKK